MGAENRADGYREINGLGRHILGELYGCRPEVLRDAAYLTTLMRRSAELCGAVVVGELNKRFAAGGGVSVLVLIQESHLSLHTWPEHGYAALDIFTCGGLIDPWIALRNLTETLQPLHINVMEIRRGLSLSLPLAKVAERLMNIDGDEG